MRRLNYEEIVRRCELLGTGSSANVYALSQKEVIKVYFPHVPDHIVDREYNASAVAAGLGLDVAPPIALIKFADRTGVVFERSHGELLLRYILRKPINALPCITRIAEYQANMHSLPVASSLPDLHDILNVRIESAPLDNKIRAIALQQIAILGRGHSLCHGDLHPGNAFIKGKRLTVIDWSKAAIGEPAADAARTELLIRYGQYGQALERVPSLRLGRHWLAESFLYNYCRSSGIRRSDVAAWRLPVAAAWYRGQATVHASALRDVIGRLAAKLQSRIS